MIKGSVTFTASSRGTRGQNSRDDVRRYRIDGQGYYKQITERRKDMKQSVRGRFVTDGREFEYKQGKRRQLIETESEGGIQVC